jgi:signal transduction histidine kinase
MNVRKKAILTIIAIFSSTLIGVILTSQTVILASFQSLEKKDTETQVNRATDALNRRILDLDTFTNSYGGWDETYQFIIDNNTAFKQSNANDQTLNAANLNLMAFVNSSGQITFSTTYNITGTNDKLVYSGLSNLISSNDALWNFSDPQNYTRGLVNIAGGLFLIASRPILTSQFTGPVRGAVLMGEEVTADLVYTLQDQTHLNIQIASLSDNNMPLILQVARENLIGRDSMFVNPVNSSLVSGSTLLDGLSGNPIALLNVNLERSIYGEGVSTVSTFTLLIIVSFIIFGSVTVLFLEKALLSRISKLNGIVSKIARSEDINQRVNLNEKRFRSSNDELNLLSKSINHMLDKIQEITASLNKSQRFAAVGELSVMIAHDLRNPLQGISFAADFLTLDKNSSPEKRARMLDLIKKDVVYSEKIVNDLLGYSKEITIAPSNIDVSSLFAMTLNHVKVPENVQIDNLVQTEPKIEVDSEKMQRVFDNLVKNAIEAMPDGGKLSVSSEVSDQKMRISFADTGKGIAKEDMDKLFVPLFTTKAKGMGFGLAICKRIIEAHQGTISAESATGKGTKFTIEIPIKRPTTKDASIPMMIDR